MKSIRLVSHSQITMASHSEAVSSSATSASLETFRWNFSIQNSTLVLGVRVLGHPGCLCQKQPCTKITLRRPLKTMSGCPGIPSDVTLNLYPRECRRLRTRRSGRVSRDRTFAICFDLSRWFRESVIVSIASSVICFDSWPNRRRKVWSALCRDIGSPRQIG